MRLSSGYEIPCPCGAVIDSYGREVCCVACHRELVVVKTA
jgi:hypothetical protein